MSESQGDGGISVCNYTPEITKGRTRLQPLTDEFKAFLLKRLVLPPFRLTTAGKTSIGAMQRIFCTGILPVND